MSGFQITAGAWRQPGSTRRTCDATVLIESPSWIARIRTRLTREGSDWILPFTIRQLGRIDEYLADDPDGLRNLGDAGWLLQPIPPMTDATQSPGRTKDELTAELGLPVSSHQDWPNDVADPERTAEYCAFYDSLRQGNPLRFDAMYLALKQARAH